MRKKASDTDILGFIDHFIDEHGYSPSLAEIGVAVGLTTRSAVSVRLARLRGRGEVTYIDHVPRTVRRTTPDERP